MNAKKMAAVAMLAVLAGCTTSSHSTDTTGGLDNGNQNCEYVMSNGDFTVKVLLEGIVICSQEGAMLGDYGGHWVPVLYSDTLSPRYLSCKLTQQTFHIRVYNVPNTAQPHVGSSAADLCLSLRNNGWR